MLRILYIYLSLHNTNIYILRLGLHLEQINKFSGIQTFKSHNPLTNLRLENINKTQITSINKAIIFYFLFYRFFSQQVSVGGRNKNKNEIHLDHFPIELKLKETQLENGPNEFYFTN